MDLSEQAYSAIEVDMMTKIQKILCVLFSWLLFLCPISASESEATVSEEILTPQAQSAYLMEMNSQREIYAKEALEARYPASMTKMMGLLLIYEEIHAGKLKLSDQVTVSETAASMGGSQVYLEVGETMSVEDLLKSICIASANDAMVAMAEKVCATHEAFVDRMNEKAKELKLENTHFLNATGLHADGHYSCAKDMAIIASALIKEGGEDLLSITSTYDAYIREESNPFWLVNTNKLIKQLEGTDGLKTGYTSQAGSCITVTTQRDGLRLIGVVMGEPDGKTRNQEVSVLMEYGFSRFEQKQLYHQGDVVTTLKDEKGNPIEVSLVAMEDAYYVVEKGEASTIKEKTVDYVRFSPPYMPDEVIANLCVTMSDGYQFSIPLSVDQEVKPAGFLDLWIRSFRQMFA